MPEQIKTTSTSSSSAKARAMVGLLMILFRTTLIILLISFLAALFPLQPSEPLWYLKIGQLSVDYGATLLFALFLLVLAGDFRSRYNKSSRLGKYALRICTASIAFFILLIPAQIISYGVNWYTSGQQVSQLIQQEQSSANALKSSIRSAKNDNEFRELLIKAALALPPPEISMKLPEQKYRVLEAVDGRFFQLRVKIENQRKQKLADLGVGAIKGVLGAGFMIYGMLSIKKILLPS